MEEGIKKSLENANADWKNEAEKRIFWLLKHKQHFTSEDVLDYLDALKIKTHNNRALGGLFRYFRTHGFIKPYGYTQAVRPSRHNAPIRVWESTVYKEEG